jgi:hypothetical protein
MAGDSRSTSCRLTENVMGCLWCALRGLPACLRPGQRPAAGGLTVATAAELQAPFRKRPGAGVVRGMERSGTVAPVARRVRGRPAGRSATAWCARTADGTGRPARRFVPRA